MKAIIMAGGEGSRLRPLTCDCPKPMLRLIDQPLLAYAIAHVKRMGIDEIAITLGYLPDAVRDYFGTGESLGVKLHYCVEETPLGTAGSVRRAAELFPGERLLVLSGDGICDFDLTRVVSFHRSHKALATLVLHASGTPQEYGMVVTDADGKITGFHEKPGRFDVYSELINTGIYVLEAEAVAEIPAAAPCDFGHELFPALLAAGAPLYGCAAQGYWCDVGDIAAYLKVHADALEGKIHLPGLERARFASEEGPMFISPRARVCSQARIEAYCVLAENCRIDEGAHLKRSLVLPGARVGKNAQLRGCVVGNGAVVETGAQLFEESVVGSASRVGERAQLLPGVKLWPQKQVGDTERRSENLVWGQGRARCFCGDAIAAVDPSEAARIVEAYCAELQPREMLLGHDPAPVADALFHAAAAGAMAQGVQVIDAGDCALPQLQSVQRQLHAEAALLAESEHLLLLGRGGAPLTDAQRRAILRLCERQDFANPFSGVTRPILSAGRTDIAYIAALAAAFTANAADAPKPLLAVPPGQLARLARQSFTRCGLEPVMIESAEAPPPQAGEIAIRISSRGARADFADDSLTLDDADRELSIARLALEGGETRLLLPANATRAIALLARKRGAQAVYMPCEPAQWLNAMQEEAPEQFRLWTDGLYCALKLLSRLTESGCTLAQWRAQMPEIHRVASSIAVAGTQSGRLLHALAEREAQSELGGGLRFQRDGGWVALFPDERLPELKIVAESLRSETAGELCSFCEAEIKKLLDEKEN